MNTSKNNTQQLLDHIPSIFVSDIVNLLFSITKRPRGRSLLINNISIEIQAGYHLQRCHVRKMLTISVNIKIYSQDCTT